MIDSINFVVISVLHWNNPEKFRQVSYFLLSLIQSDSLQIYMSKNNIMFE